MVLRYGAAAIGLSRPYTLTKHAILLDVKMFGVSHHHNGKMAAAAGHCQDSRSRIIVPSAVARYDTRSKNVSACKFGGGVGRDMTCLSDARRFSRARHA